jgi:hypothetical protein
LLLQAELLTFVMIVSANKNVRLHNHPVIKLSPKEQETWHVGSKLLNRRTDNNAKCVALVQTL